MITGLDHINIETTNLESSIKFYQDVLDLQVGWRPSFDVPGAWLYVNEQPIVHLVVRDNASNGPTGAVHHVALKASDFAATKQRLDASDLPYSITEVPDLNVKQVFVDDPNNVRLELNFYEDSAQ